MDVRGWVAGLGLSRLVMSVERHGGGGSGQAVRVRGKAQDERREGGTEMQRQGRPGRGKSGARRISAVVWIMDPRSRLVSPIPTKQNETVEVEAGNAVKLRSETRPKTKTC